MCTLFPNLYMLLTWGAYMVSMGTPYIFYIDMIKCGWLGTFEFIDGVYLLIASCHNKIALPRVKVKPGMDLHGTLLEFGLNRDSICMLHFSS